MKRFNFNFKVLISALLFLPVLLSCSDFLDDDNDFLRYSKLAIVTIRATGDNDYYFTLDSGKKMVPGNKSRVGSYEAKDGQRAFVYFNLLDESVSGYDYNADVLLIENILTKGVVPLTEETADSIGDDKINVLGIGLTEEYLTLRVNFWGTNNAQKPHMLNLVDNKMVVEENDEYIVLEFRHNAFNDVPLESGECYVSFRLNYDAAKNKKGVKFRVNTVSYGEKYYEVNFGEKR